MHQLPSNWIECAIAGGIGGLIAQLLQNNCIELMQLKNGKLYLGTLGGILISVIAGVIGDGNMLNAFVWGAVGSGFIEKLIDRKKIDLENMVCNKKEDPADK